MRNVVLSMRWVAVPVAVFFLFALFTGIAVEGASLVVVGVAVIIVSVVDLATRRQ